ncbi:MAG: hypothetical protein FD124_948 [Alphaproteobacteria bacterium]|nr:MAG: hypothetical protein FD124_948 [Alphaproteobacteria bacterium]
MRDKVLVAQPPADAAHVGVGRARNRAFVERASSAALERAQRAGEIGVVEQRSRRRRHAVRPVGAPRVLDFLELPFGEGALETTLVVGPVEGDGLRNGRAVFRIVDGGLEETAHGETPEAPMQCVPAIDGSRHSDRRRAEGRDVATALFARDAAQGFQIQPLRRTAGAIVAMEFLRPRIPHDGEHVAAHAVAGRLDEAEHRVRCNGCVDRAAAVLEDVDCDLCRQRMRGRCGAVRCDHGRARRPRRAGHAIAAAIACLHGLRLRSRLRCGAQCKCSGDQRVSEHLSASQLVRRRAQKGCALSAACRSTSLLRSRNGLQ